jgi:hypothetical protein
LIEGEDKDKHLEDKLLLRDKELEELLNSEDFYRSDFSKKYGHLTTENTRYSYNDITHSRNFNVCF